MASKREKSEIISKRELIYLKFKDILCFQNSLKSFSPILRNILGIPGNIYLFQGNQSPKFHKTYLLGD